MALPPQEIFETLSFEKKFDLVHKEAVFVYNTTNERIVPFPHPHFAGFWVTKEGAAGRDSQGYSREITDGITGDSVVVCTIE